MLCWLIAVMFGGILNGVRGVEEGSERERRVARAEEFERKMLSGERGHEFALYLRPFRLTGTLESQQVSEMSEPLDFETILAAAVRPKLRLIGLIVRKDREIIGADYVYHGNDWGDVIRRLATDARNIFVLPGLGTTIDREITWLRDQPLLSKCVFIMPETIRARTGNPLRVSPQR
jgi:hypothetical protein